MYYRKRDNFYWKDHAALKIPIHTPYPSPSTQGSRAAGGGGPKRKPRVPGGRQESGGRCGDNRNGGPRGHGATFPSAGEQVVSVLSDVGDAL